MQEKFEIGQIVNTTGLKGHVKINSFTDDITKFERLRKIKIEYKEDIKEVEIEAIRYHKNQVIIKFKNIDDINQAESLRGYYIVIDRKDAEKLPENSHYIADLIGLNVKTIEGQNLGKIKDVFKTGSNDVYEVKDELGKTILIPAIKDVVKNIDIKKGLVEIKLIEGLI